MNKGFAGKGVGYWLLIAGMVFLQTAAWAQYPTAPGQQTYPQSFPSNGTNSNLPPGYVGPPLDSLQLDSANQNTKSNIKPDVKIVSPVRLFTHQPVESRLSFDIATLPYWDQNDTVRAFLQTLGTVSKPVNVFRDGVEQSLGESDLWRNPVTGRYQYNLWNVATQTLYYDTKTPFVNVHYTQGARKMTFIDVTVSRNITPLWNATVFYRRNRFTGEYRNAISDQSVLALNQNYHSPSRRYHVFGSLTYSDASDQINGGTPRLRSSNDYQVTDGITKDIYSVYTNPLTFFKGFGSPNLGDGQSVTLLRRAYVDQYYHLFGLNDSSRGPGRLTLRHTADYQFFYRRMRSYSGIDSAVARGQINPLFPSLIAWRDTIREAYRSADYGTGGEASYSLTGPFEVHVDGGLHYRRTEVWKDDSYFSQANVIQKVAGSVKWEGYEVWTRLQQQISNKFSPERTLRLGGQISPLPKTLNFRQRLADSASIGNDTGKPLETRHPLEIFGEYSFFDRNPSIWQRYLSGRPGTSNYASNPNLVNQKYTHARAGARWNFATPIRGKDTLQAHRLEVFGFISRVDQAIYYDSLLHPLQAGPGQGYTWVGVEANFRLRFFRKMYWETRVVAQQGSTPATDALRLYAQNVPRYYGKTSLYYDNRSLSIAAIFRLGVDVYFNADYTGQTFDPMSAEFYPGSYQVPGYFRADVYWAMQLSKTFIYLKLQNVADGFPYPGYYTTAFYPMMGRTFTLGLHWNFFD